MSRFILKIIYFCIPLLFLFYAKPLYLLIDNRYKNIVAGSEIYISIKKSKQKSNKKILLIGDSVGNQLYNNKDENDSINSLASNQAIGVIGQYFLIESYLKTGNKPEIIYMLYTPFSFKNNLDQVYSFHYFLKPFYNKEYLPLFTKTALKQIDKIPYSLLCNEPYILTSNWAPNFQSKDKINYTFLSPISKEYLSKIKDLCISYNIEFFIIPTPTKESNKVKVEHSDKNEFFGYNFESDLTFFLNNIVYLNDSCFVDNVHLKKPLMEKKVLNELMIKARTHNNAHKKLLN